MCGCSCGCGCGCGIVFFFWGFWGLVSGLFLVLSRPRAFFILVPAIGGGKVGKGGKWGGNQDVGMMLSALFAALIGGGWLFVSGVLFWSSVGFSSARRLSVCPSRALWMVCSASSMRPRCVRRRTRLRMTSSLWAAGFGSSGRCIVVPQWMQ